MHVYKRNTETKVCQHNMRNRIEMVLLNENPDCKTNHERQLLRQNCNHIKADGKQIWWARNIIIPISTVTPVIIIKHDKTTTAITFEILLPQK